MDTPPTNGFRGVHPIGWTLGLLLLLSVGLTVTGSRFLLGNLSWWHWALMVAGIAVATQPPILHGIRVAIEAITKFTGSVAWKLAWLVFFVQLFNVVTRYTNNWFERDILFGQTTSLAWMSFGMLFLLGVNYGVQAGVNPRIDFWWAEFSDKKKAWIDYVFHVVLLLPFILMGIRLLIGYAGISLGRKRDGSWPEGWAVWNTWEQSGDADQLPVGPIKAFILVGFCLWGLQIIAEVIKTGFVMMGRNDLGEIEVADAPLRVE